MRFSTPATRCRAGEVAAVRQRLADPVKGAFEGVVGHGRDPVFRKAPAAPLNDLDTALPVRSPPDKALPLKGDHGAVNRPHAIEPRAKGYLPDRGRNAVDREVSDGDKDGVFDRGHFGPRSP